MPDNKKTTREICEALTGEDMEDMGLVEACQEFDDQCQICNGTGKVPHAINGYQLPCGNCCGKGFV